MPDFLIHFGDALESALGPVAFAFAISGWGVAFYLGWQRYLDRKDALADRVIAAEEAKVRGDAMNKSADAWANLVQLVSRMEGMLNAVALAAVGRK